MFEKIPEELHRQSARKISFFVFFNFFLIFFLSNAIEGVAGSGFGAGAASISSKIQSAKQAMRICEKNMVNI
jgi:hypothetical protein